MSSLSPLLLRRIAGLGLTQAALGTLAGVSTQTVVNWEATKGKVSLRKKATALRLKDTLTGEESTLEIGALFVAIGLIPQNKAFADQLPLTEEGYVDADESCTTSLPRVWVAGDTRKKALRQLATAAADGAIAGSAAVAALAGDATL